MDSSSTIYMPVLSPPTPAASPGPDTDSFAAIPIALPQNPALRQQYLASLLHSLTPAELLFVSTTIAPLLKRDFVADLPTELALMVLSFIDEPRTLVRASRVSRRWKAMVADESIWRGMCMRIGFSSKEVKAIMDVVSPDDEPLEEMEEFAQFPLDPPQQWLAAKKRKAKEPPMPSTSQPPPTFSYFLHFKQSYSTMMNWRYGGTLLRAHRMIPTPAPPNGNPPNSVDVITSVALDKDWVVVGLANSKIHVFSSRTGVLARTLVGHDAGVWGVCLVGRGGTWVGERLGTTGGDAVPAMWRTPLGLDLPVGETDPVPFPGKRSSPCSASDGWGQPNSLVVSGGCDKVLRVWDMLHNRPIAVTGSRDSTLRVWDVQRGRMIRSMSGHTGSVRCLDVCGNKAVSGSYDATCRLWNIDTGECIYVLRGHFHQIYSVAFDGMYILLTRPSQCLALLQGHTALVCQLQLSPSLPFTPHPNPILVTGGSDGRVITFSLSTYTPLHRIAAHDSSVTSLQFDARWLVTAGNDGRVRLWEITTGAYVRELSEAGESVWKVCFGAGSEDAEMGLGAGGGDVLDGHDGGGDVIAIMCKRGGKSVMEIWSFRPQDMPRL
ncbi:WD40-repeat-containing domain protein [Mycena maculata]|uniref:WD40-repeat-containing domain protein n=1 Tax=Mycena maculata TaxID=230809 RepID=A0AAD7JFT5_9AGAR|nr:WD40-repeat-containing domain protein [Mycena maculata]